MTGAEPGTIQMTEATADLLGGKFVVERRGVVPIKGKGEMNTFLLLGAQ